MKTIKTIGIIGHKGVVGSTMLNYFNKNKNYDTYGFDLLEPENKEKVVNSDVVFVCVPTPFEFDKKVYNIDIVREALSMLNEGVIACIKSTVPIGTTQKMQDEFPHLKMLFNPEFLSENSRDEDFNIPDRQFMGYTEQSKDVSDLVLDLLPKSPYNVSMPSKEAELLKYINNLHGILEVMESNHFFEVCQKEGMDYDRVLESSLQAKWVGVPMNPGQGRHYRKIFHKGYRGVGGKCFPKDLNTWVKYCEANGINSELMDAALKMNVRILSEQGLSEEEVQKL